MAETVQEVAESSCCWEAAAEVAVVRAHSGSAAADALHADSAAAVRVQSGIDAAAAAALADAGEAGGRGQDAVQGAGGALAAQALDAQVASWVPAQPAVAIAGAVEQALAVAPVQARHAAVAGV
jgi:hypothetical protein